jgi:hypothetical protein
MNAIPISPESTCTQPEERQGWGVLLHDAAACAVRRSTACVTLGFAESQGCVQLPCGELLYNSIGLQYEAAASLLCAGRYNTPGGYGGPSAPSCCVRKVIVATGTCHSNLKLPIHIGTAPWISQSSGSTCIEVVADFAARPSTILISDAETKSINLPNFFNHGHSSMSLLGLAMNATMSSGHLVKRFTELPLQGLKAWSDKVPFKMDALGLVTLLGADQVSTAIGSLQRRRYTGALPLLAAFVLAGDRLTSIQPGFTFYNVTDGFTSTYMSGWFTRWLMC